MPLLDHYQGELGSLSRSWAVQRAWVYHLANQLNERLPPEFVAWESARWNGTPDVDATSYPPCSSSEPDPYRSSWQPGPPDGTVAHSFPAHYEVQVIDTSNGQQVVAAVELVAPGNKESAADRRAFAARCVDRLHRGVGLIVIDIVTAHDGRPHDDILDLLTGGAGAIRVPQPVLLATAYRPVVRRGRTELDVWTEPVAVGRPLPASMPLRITRDVFVPVDFEASYTETCRLRRLTA